MFPSSVPCCHVAHFDAEDLTVARDRAANPGRNRPIGRYRVGLRHTIQHERIANSRPTAIRRPYVHPPCRGLTSEAGVGQTPSADCGFNTASRCQTGVFRIPNPDERLSDVRPLGGFVCRRRAVCRPSALLHHLDASRHSTLTPLRQRTAASTRRALFWWQLRPSFTAARRPNASSMRRPCRPHVTLMGPSFLLPLTSARAAIISSTE